MTLKALAVLVVGAACLAVSGTMADDSKSKKGGLFGLFKKKEDRQQDHAGANAHAQISLHRCPLVGACLVPQLESADCAKTLHNSCYVTPVATVWSVR